MRITRIETIAVRVPIIPARAIRHSGGLHSESPFLLLRVHTDVGLTGLGEVSCTPRWSGEDHATAARLIATVLEPELVGEDAAQVERLARKMAAALPNNAFTRAGIEMALWDLLGKAASLPLYSLLGGLMRPCVTTKFSVSGFEPPRAAEIAAWAVEQGFRTIKVKVGIQPEEDVARVRAVRDAVGANTRIGVDANGGWSPRVAIQCLRRMAEYGIGFAEQPVAPPDPASLAEVRRAVDVPIIADESVYTPQDALALARAGAADALSVYVGKGGISQARQTAAVAEAAGLACTVGSNLELGVAAAAMIHLAVSTPAVDSDSFPCDILTPFYYERSLLREPLAIRPGRAEPPSGPGLGVELDENAVDEYRVEI